MENEELDFTKLKYVLYARKSTDDPERQVRSTDDQVDECELLAKRLKIRIVDVIVEKKSAKKPGKRPLFSQMLRDIRQGKYDGIIAWNPDRLARNMKEGGEIIDMIDDNFIIDMKFVTHHFSKDANGKMLLGMAFVLSKQYSDNLSQNVTRGVRKNLEEGKSPKPKHGYIRDDDGLNRPDDKNFDLIKKAWQMRLEGISLEDIATNINEQGYARFTKGKKDKARKKIVLTKQILTDVFKDPFYYGILVQANQEVDLRRIYNFEPVISEEEYIQVQMLSSSRKLPYKKTKTATYYPLKGLIRCSYCTNLMYVGAPQGGSGKKKRYLSYRCDKAYCIRNSKENRAKERNDPTRIKSSIRGKIIFNYIYNFMEKGLNFTEKEYNEYLTSMNSLTREKREKIKIEIYSLEGTLKARTREKEDIAYKVLNLDEHSPIRLINEKRVDELQQEEETLKMKIAKLKNSLGNPQQEALSIEEFLNLSRNAAKKVKSANAMIKDYFCRKIFLNLTVDDKNVLSHQANEPFETLLKQRDKSSGRVKAINLELLTDSILTYWKPQISIDLTNITLSQENTIRAQNEGGFMYYY